MNASFAEDGAVLRAIALEAERTYPREGCGIVVQRGRVARAIALANVHAAPERHFEIEPVGLLRALRAAEQEGEVLVAIFHSHPEGRARLSREDLARARMPDGSPAFPGVLQVVVSVRGALARELMVFEPVEAGASSPERIRTRRPPAASAPGRTDGRVRKVRLTPTDASER